MRSSLLPLFTSILIIAFAGSARAAWTRDVGTCDQREYQSCIAMADPLLRDPRLVFPDNMADIDHVCRTWTKFVDCVKRYTERCFSPARRQQFNQAVQRSVDSVHQMCTQTPYQSEYLSHAACIKSTLTEDVHCGTQYKHLADIVAGQQPVTSRVHICWLANEMNMFTCNFCLANNTERNADVPLDSFVAHAAINYSSHHWFRECVLKETRRQCDAGLMGSATRFATHILDKALSFLREDCTNYIPTSGDCPTGEAITPPPPRGNDESGQQQRDTPRYPATSRNRDSSRFQMGRSSRLPLDDRSSIAPQFPQATPPAPTPAPPGIFNPWNPNPVAPDQPEPTPWVPARPGNPVEVTNNPVTNPPWNNEPITWGLDTSTRIAGLGDGNVYIHSTESWYPEAGNAIIDEPNQQGLQRGGGARLHSSILLALLGAAYILLRL